MYRASFTGPDTRLQSLRDQAGKDRQESLCTKPCTDPMRHDARPKAGLQKSPAGATGKEVPIHAAQNLFTGSRCKPVVPGP